MPALSAIQTAVYGIDETTAMHVGPKATRRLSADTSPEAVTITVTDGSPGLPHRNGASSAATARRL